MSIIAIVMSGASLGWQLPLEVARPLYSRAVQRATYRPWVQRVVLVVVMAVLLLISVSGFTVGDIIARRDWFAIILYGLTAAASVPGIWLAARLGVVVDERGIHLHNFGRGRFIPWSQVSDVSCVVYDRRAGLPLFAPAVQINGEDAPVVLSALGSYREDDAERRTEAIRSLLA